MSSIGIPFVDNTGVVVVPLDNLPSSASDVTNILTAELAPLEYWLQFALEYYKRGHLPQFLTILTTLDSEEAQRAYVGQEFQNDKVSVLNALAAYHIITGIKENSIEKKTQSFEKATGRINHSIGMMFQNPTTWNCQGLLNLARYSGGVVKDVATAKRNLNDAVSNAFKNFENALSLDPSNIPALLGHAICLYHMGKYEEASSRYFKALSLNPELPAFVRVGIGMCYFKMKEYDLARASFLRTLELDSNDANALYGMAVLELNDQKPDAQRVADYIGRAYSANPSHPGILLLTANHFFYQGKYAAAGKLLQRSLLHSTTNELIGNTQFQIARVYHTQHKYKSAANHYSEALRYMPDFELAHFGAGQIAIHSNDLKRAIEHFEFVYQQKKFSQNFDVLRILGSLYNQTKNKKKALELLSIAHQLAPSDLDVLLELGQLCETVKPNQAYNCYKKAISIMKERHLVTPSQLWNNIGVVCQHLKKYDESRIAFLNSCMSASTVLLVENGADIETVDKLLASDVTAVFNLGVNAALLGDFSVAERLQQYILQHFPDYIDSHLHLAEIALQCGRLVEARSKLDECLKIDPDNVTIFSMIVQIHVLNNDSSAARELLEKMHNKDKDDVFCRFGSGLLKIMSLQSRKKANEKNKTDSAVIAHDFKSAQHAGSFFRSVLKRQHDNVYAALGLGVVLAHQGQLLKARDVFLQCRDSNPELLEVWVNLAHVYAKDGSWESAITTYRHCLDKFKHMDVANYVSIMQCLASALYQKSELIECKQVLLKAWHLDPTNEAILYDLAITQEHFFIHILQISRTERTFRDVELAVNDLQSAHQILKGLAARHGNSSGSRTNGIGERAKRHVKFVRDMLQYGQLHLDDAKTREKELQEQAERTRLGALQAEKIFEEEKAQALLEVEKERERLEELAKSQKVKLQKLQDEVHLERKIEKQESDLKVVPLTEEEIAAGITKKPKRQTKIKLPRKRKRAEKSEQQEPEEDVVDHESLGYELPNANDDEEEFAELKRMRDSRNPALKALVEQQQQNQRHTEETVASPEKATRKKRSRLRKTGGSDDDAASDGDVIFSDNDENKTVSDSQVKKKKRKIIEEE